MNLPQFFKRIKNIPPSSRVYNLTGSSMGLLLAVRDKPFIAIESADEAARQLYGDILFYRSLFRLPDRAGNVFFLPEPDGTEACGKRAEAVLRFKEEGDSIAASVNASNASVWSLEELKKNVLSLRGHLEMSRDDLEQRLVSMGYKRTSIVADNGEFSRRGWLFDVFPSTADNPLRLEFFGDTIDTIKTFDISTQKSINKAEQFLVFPAAEPANGVDILSIAGGIECFCADSACQLRDFPASAVTLSKFSFPLQGAPEVATSIDAGFISMSGYGIYHDERKDISEFPPVIKKMAETNKVVIVSSSIGQAGRIKDVLANGDVIAPVIAREDTAGYEGRIAITVGELSSGLFMQGLLILTEKEIFGGRPAFRPIKKSKVSKLLLSLDDLSIGDFVVHKDHGIGKFSGLVKRAVKGYEGDLMILEYSGGDRLYLPLYAIDRIKKYHAEEGMAPKIDNLGGRTWQRTKERVGKKIREMAEKLLRLYAEREVSKGFMFSGDLELHREFDSFFSYEETADQIRAIDEIKSDMESERPMDRLLCGDVGYGKTEVAMRAAFKAVYDNRQVAVLVPTTLLCEQHYRTFKQRFSAFPVTVDYLSRFKSRNEQVDTVKRAAKGDIDILIGTHALLRGDIHFPDLGLLIIDEEQRFGVAQKEKIKELKRGVDVLTLSATPIPRTLNMALSGIRGMSLIETPPEERLAVKSIVSIFSGDIIKEAVNRELERSGQVYFVHNRVAEIEKLSGYVKRLVPSARIAVAHGQMRERELEKIMQEFIDKEINVLVCTAIIGSGLDIPSANTIIIDRADMMGLADLYQLRGRVGRSNIKAYAYFLIPGEDIIADEAKKRLQAIQDMSYLGAGFRLAMKDLEIRGTGNMLGPEQSGYIHAVGFDMYIEMLERAVAELRGLKVEEEVEPHISLRISAFIPEEFVEDITLRLSVYRRIASARNDEDLSALMEELRDRFGKFPKEVQNLFDVMSIKIPARKLFIKDVEESDGNIRVAFSKVLEVSVEKMLNLRNIMGGRLRFLKQGFELKVKNISWQEKIKLLKEIFDKLS